MNTSRIYQTVVLFFLSVSLFAQSNNALNFDGSNDYVSIPSSSQINFGTSTDFTLEAWIKLYGSQPSYAGIIAKADNSQSIYYQLVIVENKIAAEISNGGAFVGIWEGLWGTTNLYDGSWHHLAMVVTRSTSNVKLYVDGVVDANATHSAVGSDLNNSGNMLLGTERATAKYFYGSIEEIRVWNKARSQAEIQNNMNVEVDPSSSGLVAYYRLDQGTAGGDNSAITYATDATSYTNNGTLNNFALTGETSNWITANNPALPVELTSFTASVTDGKVLLNWQTATEVKNYGFEVQRSEVSGQSSIVNSQWKKIGFVQGNGNSNSTKSYSFTDTTPPSGKVQYRLKQIDFDGKYEYSKDVEVKVETPTQFSLAQNYPNPFNPETVISFQLPVKINLSLKVYDVLGNEVATLVNEEKPAGKYTISFNIQQTTNTQPLSSGVYYYQLITRTFVDTKKFIILK